MYIIGSVHDHTVIVKARTLTQSIFSNCVYVTAFREVKWFVEIHLSPMIQNSFERPNPTSKTKTEMRFSIANN